MSRHDEAPDRVDWLPPEDHVAIARAVTRSATSPNDIVVKSDGTVWFTDPDYGSLHPELGHGKAPEQDRNRVYRFVPETGALTAVSEDFDKPNGIAFSPDESVLYVGDTGRTHGEFRAHRVMALFEQIPAWSDEGDIPSRSLLREFIGGSEYDY